MNNKKLIIPLAALALLGGAATGIAGHAAAQSATQDVVKFTKRAVGGTISSISGNTITLTGKDGATYTINAADAEIHKMATVAVSDLAVGDTLMVGGDINGNTVTAKHIMSGNLPEGDMMLFGPGHRGMGPGVVGTVSAVNGATITVTGKDDISYTIDASAAKILTGGGPGAAPTEGSLSDIAVGDMIGAHGTISGTTVTATEIHDGIQIRAFKMKTGN